MTNTFTFTDGRSSRAILKEHAIEGIIVSVPVVRTENGNIIVGIPNSCKYGHRLVNRVLSLPGLGCHMDKTLPNVHW